MKRIKNEAEITPKKTDEIEVIINKQETSNVKDLVDIHKKHVVVSGLDGDYNRNTFGDIIKLIPICDNIDKLSSYCNKCNNGKLATFTKKISKLNDSSCQDNVLDIGGSEKYIPVCRYHYLN